MISEISPIINPIATTLRILRSAISIPRLMVNTKMLGLINIDEVINAIIKGSNFLFFFILIEKMTGITPKRVIGERAPRADDITSINSVLLDDESLKNILSTLSLCQVFKNAPKTMPPSQYGTITIVCRIKLFII